MNKRDINLQGLSGQMLFSEYDSLKTEDHLDDVVIIHPDPAVFTHTQAISLMPSMHVDEQDVEGRHNKLREFFETHTEDFVPTLSVFFRLLSPNRTAGELQAILYLANNPCRIVELDESAILTIPGDVSMLRHSVIGAFLLMGYLPPLVLIEPMHSWAYPKAMYEQAIHQHVDGVIYHFGQLSEALC